MKGWTLTIWFESQQAALDAAEAIGRIVSEEDLNALDARPDIVRAFGKPSMALAVGLEKREIPHDRRTAQDR